MLGEDIAIKHLLSKGFRIVERNFHSKFGEIDIIAQKGGFYYFFEVKYRTTAKWGGAEEGVSSIKRLRLYSTINYWLMKNYVVEECVSGLYLIAINQNSRSKKPLVKCLNMGL